MSQLNNEEEIKVINPLKGKSANGWHFEQQVYDAEGVARAVKSGGGEWEYTQSNRANNRSNER